MRNVLEITAAKSVVLPEESRNSFMLPLEEVGFGIDYDRFKKELIVLDGKEKIARIFGVSGMDSIQRRRKYSPVYIIGSDVYDEMFENSPQVIPYIRTKIGECTLKILATDEMNEDFINKVDGIYTKFPESLNRILSEKYNVGSDIFQSDYGRSSRELLDGLINFSSSPDTEIADLKGFNPQKDYAAWERVGTSETAQNLGLTDVGIPELEKNISTNVYAVPGRLNVAELEKLDLMRERIGNTRFSAGE